MNRISNDIQLGGRAGALLRRAMLIGATVAIATAVAACGTGTTSPQGPGSNASTQAPTVTKAPLADQGGAKAADPCGLVTPDQVAKVLRAPIAPSGPYEEYRGTHCKWDVADGPSLLVSVYQGKEFYDPDIASEGSHAVQGLGDSSFSDGLTQTVGFLKGETFVTIFIPAFYKVEMADLEAMAVTAAGRL